MIGMLKNRDADIHSETAARIFNIDIDSVSKDMRRKAKEVNFGLIYGMESVSYTHLTLPTTVIV